MAVGAERNAPDPIGVPLQSAQNASCTDFPEAHRMIRCGAGQRVAIRTECNAENPVSVAPQCEAGLSCDLCSELADIPQPYGMVPAAAGQGAAVRVEGDRPNPPLVPIQTPNS